MGRLLLVSALVAWPIGFTAQLIELQLLAVAFGACLVSALFLAVTSPCTVTIVVPRHHVGQGRPAKVTLRVANLRPRPLPASRLEIVLGGSTRTLLVPSLRAGASHEVTLEIPTPRRGTMWVGPILSVRSDPLSLVRRRITRTAAEPLTVTPTCVPLPGGSLPERNISRPGARHPAPAATGMAAGRDRHIRRPMPQPVQAALVLDTRGPSYPTAQDLELAVSVAASLGAHLLRHHVPLSTITGPDAVRVHTAYALLHRYARVEASSTNGSNGRVPRRIGRRRDLRIPAQGTVGPGRATKLLHVRDRALADASTVLVVGGPNTDTRPYAVAHRARVMVLRCDTTAQVSFLRGRDLDVVTLSGLEQLQRVWRVAAI